MPKKGQQMYQAKNSSLSCTVLSSSLLLWSKKQWIADTGDKERRYCWVEFYCRTRSINWKKWGIASFPGAIHLWTGRLFCYWHFAYKCIHSEYGSCAYYDPYWLATSALGISLVSRERVSFRTSELHKHTLILPTSWWMLHWYRGKRTEFCRGSFYSQLLPGQRQQFWSVLGMATTNEFL